MTRLVIPPALVLCLLGCACRTQADQLAELRRIEDRREERSERLSQAIVSGERWVRLRALLAAARIQSPFYLEALAAAAADASVEIRREALFAIGQLGLRQKSRVPESARAIARAALKDADPFVRADAVEALGKLGDAEVAIELIAALRDEAALVRATAATALFRCRFAPTWRGEAQAPPPLPPSATLALIDAMHDAEPDVRYRAVYAFSRFGEARAARSLAGMTQDEDWRVRLFAVRGLGKSQPSEAERARLIDSLSDSRLEIRVEAIQALAAAGASDRIPDACLADPAYAVRAACADGWATAADRRSMHALPGLREDPSLSVRIAALRTLVARNAEGHESLLDAAAEDSSWRMRAVAAASGTTPEQRLIRARRAFEERDVRVRTAALGGIAGSAGGEALLRLALPENDLALRGSAVEEIATIGPSSPAQWHAALVTAAPSPYVGVAFDEDPQIVFQTTHGPIVIRCFADEAPIHVAAVVDLVDRGFYDGLSWHRVVPNFVIQGGDPRGDGWGGAGFTLRDEVHRRRFERGTVGMPKAGKDSGGGQLFIAQVPTPHLDGNYTILGQVIEGLELLDLIEIGDTIVRAERR